MKNIPFVSKPVIYLFAFFVTGSAIASPTSMKQIAKPEWKVKANWLGNYSSRTTNLFQAISSRKSYVHARGTMVCPTGTYASDFEVRLYSKDKPSVYHKAWLPFSNGSRFAVLSLNKKIHIQQSSGSTASYHIARALRKDGASICKIKNKGAKKTISTNYANRLIFRVSGKCFGNNDKKLKYSYGTSFTLAVKYHCQKKNGR